MVPSLCAVSILSQISSDHSSPLTADVFLHPLVVTPSVSPAIPPTLIVPLTSALFVQEVISPPSNITPTIPPISLSPSQLILPLSFVQLRIVTFPPASPTIPPKAPDTTS